MPRARISQGCNQRLGLVAGDASGIVGMLQGFRSPNGARGGGGSEKKQGFQKLLESSKWGPLLRGLKWGPLLRGLAGSVFTSGHSPAAQRPFQGVCT